MTENKCLWLFGLSGAGKTTLANALADKLSAHKVKVLDGDILRKGIKVTKTKAGQIGISVL